MPNYVDQDISGVGSVAFAGTANELVFLVLHLTTLGADVRHPDPADSQMILRAGYLSFGISNASIGSARDYWEFPIHIDMVDFRWVPNSGSPGGTLPVHRASRVRWRLSPGTAGHLLIFGN